jgi:hypothetical protein
MIRLIVRLQGALVSRIIRPIHEVCCSVPAMSRCEVSKRIEPGQGLTQYKRPLLVPEQLSAVASAGAVLLVRRDVFGRPGRPFVAARPTFVMMDSHAHPARNCSVKVTFWGTKSY